MTITVSEIVNDNWIKKTLFLRDLKITFVIASPLYLPIKWQGSLTLSILVVEE